MSPTSSTTTTSQRPLTYSSRSPPATAGPQICMTWSSMTTPSAERSFHHCFRSKKMQRAVDKLITLLTKACCQVSRCLSVLLEQGDLFPMSLDRQFQTSQKIHVATQKMSKSGFFWNDKKSIFSLIVEQRFKKHESQGRLWQKKHPKVEWSYRVSKRRNLSCSWRRRTTSTRSTTSSWTNYWNKNRGPWSSWEKSQWDGRIEEISRLNIRYNCEEKIGRRSRYYPWTHRQDSGTTEWNSLYEWFERFSRCWISTQWTFPRYQSTSVFLTSSEILAEC